MKLTEKEFLEAELKAGISIDNPSFMALATKTAELVSHIAIDYIATDTETPIENVHVLDFGPGVGAYSKALLDLNMRVTAYEKFDSHKEYLAEKLPNLILHDEPVPCDLLLMIEVAEHMTDEEIKKALSVSRPEFIFFSSTPQRTPQDEQWGHINIKSEEQWNNLLENIEVSSQGEKTLSYLCVGFSIVPTAWTRIYCKIKDNELRT